MKLTIHDLLALAGVVGVFVLVALGKLDAAAALTFVGGLVLRSPIDRPTTADTTADTTSSPGD